ncbi:MAG: hypothetical protein UY79_C0003G0070 [Parcubacteria group bacterium GW2011_GWA2_53_21]|nr:MAG: hypothetical protein UY79_C0003G0070 [Parcubacteria group bacterium GW2011_GWA2_53_21]
MMKRLFIVLALGILLTSSTHVAHASEPAPKTATVFFNEACEDCGELVKETYPLFFEEYGYALERHDYINERSNRTLLGEYNKTWGVPFELQSHIETFIDNRLLIGGHVPEDIIRYLLEHPDAYGKLLVYQDNMHGEETDYRVWDFAGEVRTYPIGEPITTYLQEDRVPSQMPARNRDFWSLWGIVTSSAFLDGLNPCAFAVLLFFIGFLFTLKKTRAKIWQMGLVYIGAIYESSFPRSRSGSVFPSTPKPLLRNGCTRRPCRHPSSEDSSSDCAPFPARAASTSPSSACSRRKVRRRKAPSGCSGTTSSSSLRSSSFFSFPPTIRRRRSCKISNRRRRPVSNFSSALS